MIVEPRTEALVVRYIARIAVPFIQLFALYVLGHGEDGPGGGFQSGVIFAAAYILYTLANGWEAGRRQWPQPASDAVLPSGALLYGAIGLVTMLLGGAFLEYAQFAGGGHSHAAHEFGLMGIEIGVALTVAASIATLFFELARPKRFLDPPGARGSDGNSSAASAERRE
ncbi:MAG: MnhB domain-containing protein [Planctomycetota bacterium]